MGGTCLLIASKVEEYRAPELRDICYIMDNAYRRDEIIDMEVAILNRLEFNITPASPLQFLEIFLRGVSVNSISKPGQRHNLYERDSELHLLSQFFLECCLVEADLVGYLPSQLACVSLYAATRMLYGGGHGVDENGQPQQKRDVRVEGPYTNPDFLENMEIRILRAVSIQKDRALGKKYSKDRYLNVMRHVRKFEQQ